MALVYVFVYAGTELAGLFIFEGAVNLEHIVLSLVVVIHSDQVELQLK